MSQKASENTIVVQSLGVTYAHLAPGPEYLRYAPGALMDGMPEPETKDVPTKALLLRRQISQVRQKIEELLWRARLGNRRDGSGIEPEAAELAKLVLPQSGFSELVRPGLHPHFLIERDLASEIPWEVLDDPGGETGKLSVDRFLTYRVRGGEPPKRAGNAFLLIEDPTQNTCDPSSDPEGRCAAHLAQLKEMLAGAGYRVWEVKRRNATVLRVKSALQNPDVVGMYFFGHGYFPEHGDEGRLALADGPLLAREIEAARPDIRFVFLNACQSAARGEQHWSLEHKSNSVAEMFARGGLEKTVIAPIFPVLNTQAAEAAIRFFTLALSGETLGESLRRTRRESLTRYQQDEPDITWAAYRYFGDARRLLPRGDEAPRTTAPGVEMPAKVRVFDEEGKLNLDLFAFQLRPVLLRAAKRRTSQHRRDVTSADLLAGLLRTGDLTRFAIRQQKQNPDDLYKKLLALVEKGEPAAPESEEPAPAPPAPEEELPQDQAEREIQQLFAELERLFGRFRVREERQFTPAAADVLRQADLAAQRRGDAAAAPLISEQDVLLALMSDEGWAIDVEPDLPPAADVRRWLELPFEQRSVDENGRLVLSALTTEARQIIEEAHQQAQQRGVSPIPNRLVLASFLGDPRGFPARCCARHGVDAKTMAGLLVSATPAAAPNTFDLTHDVCQRVVLPMLAGAARIQKHWRQAKIDVPLLFKAYCEVANVDFVETLRSPELPDGVRIDLRAMGNAITREAVLEELQRRGPGKGKRPASPAVPPSAPAPQAGPPRIPIAGNGAARRVPAELDLDEPLRRVLAAASQIAAIQGYSEIRSPHLFVALVSYGADERRAALDGGPLTRDQLVLNVLSIVPSQQHAQEPSREVRLGSTVRRWLDQAREAAAQRGGGPIREGDLWRVMLSEPEGIIVQSLIGLGYESILKALSGGTDPSGETTT